jgi:hypothetical protein
MTIDGQEISLPESREEGLGVKTFASLKGREGTPRNVYGRATLLLSLLYRAGSLPELSVYGKEPDECPDMLYINENPVGVTDAEVTNSIWDIVARFQQHGYLFD